MADNVAQVSMQAMSRGVNEELTAWYLCNTGLVLNQAGTDAADDEPADGELADGKAVGCWWWSVGTEFEPSGRTNGGDAANPTLFFLFPAKLDGCK